MEFKIVSGINKKGKVKNQIIGFDLMPKENPWIEMNTINISDQKKFCQDFPHRIINQFEFARIDITYDEKKIVISSSELGICWDEYSFNINEKEAKALKNILKTNYTFETTEDSIFQLRIDKDRTMNRYPGSKQAKKIRKKIKRAKKKK